MTAPPPPEEPRRVAPGAARVLVVDDSDISRHVSARILAKLGCAVEHASTGEGALAALAEGGFDLVLMDCQMPDADGRDVTRAHRQHERLTPGGKRVPIVALTGSTHPEERGSCLAAGMDDFLTKPFTMDEMRELLRRWTSPALG